MGDAPDRDEVQRVTVEISDVKDKTKWEQFKREMASLHRKYRLKLKFVEIANFKKNPERAARTRSRAR